MNRNELALPAFSTNKLFRETGADRLKFIRER